MTSQTSSYASRLPLWVLIGTQAQVLQPVGQTHVKLMEVVVFPYIICSPLHGLGRLEPDTAWRLFRCSWLVYVIVWGTTILIILLLSIAIPAVPPPDFIDANALQDNLSLLDHPIPANPFLTLARNYVPAIVIFSIVYGIAIQRVDDKETFLQILDLICGASVETWRWVVLLAPFGVCALFAKTSGTLDQAKAWTTQRTDYTAAVPDNLGSPFLIAYLLPENADRLTRFLNYWTRLQRAKGFLDHMIDGKANAVSTPRWSIMCDTLGWGD